MLSRPSDNGHTPFGDIFYSESPDMEFWGRHRHVMSPAPFEDSAWQCTKIGAGPIPIETSEGWLLIYHGVLASCNGFVYSFGSALLDIDQPWKVKFRSGPYLISPQKDYECMGDVPNVCFPCAALHDSETGRIAIYYGCADTVTGLAFGYIPEIIEFYQTYKYHLNRIKQKGCSYPAGMATPFCLYGYTFSVRWLHPFGCYPLYAVSIQTIFSCSFR